MRLDRFLRNYLIQFNLFINYKPNFVFHLAAQSLVKVSYQDPFLTWQTNTMGTVSILESLKSIRNRRRSIRNQLEINEKLK